MPKSRKIEPMTTLVLTLAVRYEANGVSADDLKERLEGIVEHALAEGLLTSSTEAEVDGVSTSVMELDSYPKLPGRADPARDTWDADVDKLISELGTGYKAHNVLAERFQQYALAAETFAMECRQALTAMLAADRTGDAEDLVERVIEAENKLGEVVGEGELGKLGAAYGALHTDR